LIMSSLDDTKELSASVEQLMRANIDLMNSLMGFDVIIVCCSNENQAKYWKKRLDKGRGSLINAEIHAYVVLMLVLFYS
jgi:hypothetical protein